MIAFGSVCFGLCTLEFATDSLLPKRDDKKKMEVQNLSAVVRKAGPLLRKWPVASYDGGSWCRQGNPGLRERKRQRSEASGPVDVLLALLLLSGDGNQPSTPPHSHRLLLLQHSCPSHSSSQDDLIIEEFLRRADSGEHSRRPLWRASFTWGCAMSEKSHC